jgi:hypothetical protein
VVSTSQDAPGPEPPTVWRYVWPDGPWWRPAALAVGLATVLVWSLFSCLLAGFLLGTMGWLQLVERAEAPAGTARLETILAAGGALHLVTFVWLCRLLARYRLQVRRGGIAIGEARTSITDWRGRATHIAHCDLVQVSEFPRWDYPGSTLWSVLTFRTDERTARVSGFLGEVEGMRDALLAVSGLRERAPGLLVRRYSRGPD